MEASGVFRCDEDMEINGRYSFKSLLLDGEVMDEDGMDGAHLVLTGDLEGVEETLYRDDGMGGRESFKSLLMDGENMEEDEVHFSPREASVGIDNQVQYSEFPTTAPVVALGTEEVESISMDNQGVDFVDQQVVDSDEAVPVEDTKASLRICDRYDDRSPAAVEESIVSAHVLDPLEDPGCTSEHGLEIVLQPQPLSSLPPSPLLESLPLPKKRKQANGIGSLSLSKKKKQGATSRDVQKLLDSVIARQEIFFADLLESMERKEAIRERTRDEKEEKWRAEERAQSSVFNNAMLALTQDLLDDSVLGSLVGKAK